MVLCFKHNTIVSDFLPFVNTLSKFFFKFLLIFFAKSIILKERGGDAFLKQRSEAQKEAGVPFQKGHPKIQKRWGCFLKKKSEDPKEVGMLF